MRAHIPQQIRRAQCAATPLTVGLQSHANNLDLSGWVGGHVNAQFRPGSGEVERVDCSLKSSLPHLPPPQGSFVPPLLLLSLISHPPTLKRPSLFLPGSLPPWGPFPPRIPFHPLSPFHFRELSLRTGLPVPDIAPRPPSELQTACQYRTSRGSNRSRT